jgi:alpha-glucosidase (family GH31 glycosyl hydrolase)
MFKHRFIPILIFVCALSIGMHAQNQQSHPSIAYQDKSVRFTVITDGTIRMEWSPVGQFVDDKSFVAVNRSYPAAHYFIDNRDKTVTIKTAKMILKYKKDTGKFSSSNLSVVSVKGMIPFKWKPGTVPSGNLKGTYRTLDRFDGDSSTYTKKKMQLEDGLLSTEGWTFLDDSNSYLFDNSDWPWVKERINKDGQDWYFMAYGHDYKTALKDFTVFAGKVPLPPRYAFGYWWSRYWCYTENEMRDLVNDFHTYGIPLDVLVVDMDWHYTESGKGGWTGFTWNRRLFPNPDAFLKYLKTNDLQITLNLHPASGVASYEESFPAMAKWMGVPDTTKVIPYQSSNKRFMSGWLNTVLKPLEKKGVDFWWLDWQQGLYDNQFKQLSNTWWINYVFFSNMELHGDTRPLLYHRWGGLGNHRYQIGFSGDTYITWASLELSAVF